MSLTAMRFLATGGGICTQAPCFPLCVFFFICLFCFVLFFPEGICSREAAMFHCRASCSNTGPDHRGAEQERASSGVPAFARGAFA